MAVREGGLSRARDRGRRSRCDRPVLLWSKVALNSLRESRHPRRVLAYWLLGLGLLVALTVLGVKLPNEGG